jgi:SH3-like domain-containing protein
MSRRRRSLALRSLTLGLAAAAVFAATPVAVFAEDAAPVVDNSKVSFAGQINSNAVYVRSGPGENYYATLKLDKGATVTVVGLKFDWLKINPPDGSFCYVAKAYVEKRGDGTVGRVTKPDLNVRAGSDLNAMKTTVQTKLDQNEDVTILGEQDEYFKIKPPAGAYLYVNKQFVDPVKPLPPVATANPSTGKESEPISSAPMAAAVGAAPIVSKTPDAPAPGATATATTKPSNEQAAAPTTQGSEEAAATTQPAPPTAEAQFDTLESAFLDATNQPLEKQPIDELLTKYTELSKNSDLPISMERIAEMRIGTLKLRSDARNQYLEAQKMQAEAKERQQALKAEQEELTQRVKDNEVQIYAALGTLRTSSLQQAGQTLYRLTDPGTGRTLLYMRSSDPKIAGMLNSFIGVRGEITEDTTMSLKIISPTEVTNVDQSKVGSTITAQVIPPTLLPKAPTASISGN